MKKLCSIILTLILLNQATGARDLVYIISGEVAGMPVSLDSILVENMTNQTRIVFGNLPARKDYIINLSQGAFQGTTGIVPVMRNNGFTILQNQPGFFTLTNSQPAQEELNVAVYNMNGQKIYAVPSFSMTSFNRLSMEIGIPGVFVVTVSSGHEKQSFKVLGHPGAGNILVSSVNLQPDKDELKNGSLSGPADFRFQPGDSLRISVYRNAYFAYPRNFRIGSSDTLSFSMILNNALISGISNAYVDRYSAEEVISWQPSTGKTILSVSAPVLNRGDVIILEPGNGGFLRKVVSSRFSGDSMITETRQAFLNDVFVDKAFRLSTRFMTPRYPVSGNSSPVEIANALTDKDGWFHPAEIILHGDNDQYTRISPVDSPSGLAAGFPGISYEAKFQKSTISGNGTGDISFYAEEAEVSLAVELMLEFDFTRKGDLDPETKADKGTLRSFSYFLKCNTNLKSLFGLNLKKSCEKEGKAEKLIPTQRISVKYFIEGIPVWLDVNFEVLQDFQISSGDSFYANWGYDQRITSAHGAVYNTEANTFTPFSQCEQVSTSDMVQASGDADARARFSLYPGIGISVFGTPGIYSEVVPFGEAIYKARMQEVSPAPRKDSALCWNGSLRAGLEMSTAANLEMAGLPEVVYRQERTDCADQEIWRSPVKLILQSALPSGSKPGSGIRLTFLVTDIAGNSVPGCPVYIQGEGYFSHQVIETGQSGTADFDWTLSQRTGYDAFKAVIFNSQKSVLSSVSDSVRVYDPDAYGSFTFDGRTYKTKKMGSYIWMTGNLAFLPSVSSPSSGSTVQPFCYVPGYYGSDISEAKSTPGYSQWGVMYNWPAAMNGETPSAGNPVRGICPPGWHLPGDKEWTDLLLYLIYNGYGVGGSGNRVAKSMASGSNWDYSGISGTPGNDPGSNNSSEFTGLPGGFRCNDAKDFTSKGSFASWWIPSESGTESGFHFGFFNNTSVVIKYYSNKARGYFIRCVQD